MADETQNNDKTQTNGETPPKETAEKEISPIDEAKQLLAENKKVLEGLREERIKLEKAVANAAISGKGFAGKPTEKREETPKEYAERIMRGE